MNEMSVEKWNEICGRRKQDKNLPRLHFRPYIYIYTHSIWGKVLTYYLTFFCLVNWDRYGTILVVHVDICMYVCIFGFKGASTCKVIGARNEMMMDDYDSQWYLGIDRAYVFLTFALQLRKNPEKNLTQETCPDRGSNPGPLHDKHTCYHLFHSGGQCMSKNPEGPVSEIHSPHLLVCAPGIF